LDTISLEVEQGELVALLGPSGCGKSTLLNLIAGFEAPSDGCLLVNGQAVAAPGPERGVVFQEAALFPWLTVWENVIFGPKVQGLARSEYEDRAHEMLKIVGLVDFKNHLPVQLSGGMRQRVGIARILTLGSRVLLMDEPFGALDAQTRVVMQEELVRLARKNPRTVLFITHAVEEAVYLADRIVVMTRRPGTIREIIDVKSIREAEGWDAHKRIEDVMDLPSFVHLRTHVWKLLREQQGDDTH
jgi:NitT/TauT family transport system ATP-binding protein